MKTSEFSVESFNDPISRNSLLASAELLIRYAAFTDQDSIVYLDRGARPAAWLVESMWPVIYPEQPVPEAVFMNIGREKNFRDRYMNNRGSALNMVNNTRSFVGNCDSRENIELFKQRVAADSDCLEQLATEVGPEAEIALRNRRVLIVDDWEFEGVSRLFAETAITQLYNPSSLNYFQFGPGIQGIPNGLADVDVDSFIAPPSPDPYERQRSQSARQDIGRVVLMYSKLPPIKRRLARAARL